jgi:c-di-GMP-binding flagellar brake protein YcgR
MGMTTPFPEPDSSELQRFAVRAAADVAGLMQALCRHAVPLNAYFDDGGEFDVAAVLEVDEGAGTVVLEGPEEDARRSRLLSAPAVTFVGFLEALKLQFNAVGVQPATHAGRPAIRVPMPAQVLRIERRSSPRLSLQTGRPTVCRIPLADGTFEPLRVLDIGAGGLAVLTYPGRTELKVGAEIAGCRLDLPGIGGTEVRLRVRHVGPLAEDEKARCCGCEFAGLAPTALAALRGFLRKCCDAGGGGRDLDASTTP